MNDGLAATLGTIGGIGVAMAAVAAIETVVPLHGRSRRIHLAPNLALTLLTFATSAAMNVALVAALVRLDADRAGLLRWTALPPLAAGVVAVLGLDFSFYVAHVAMHAVPAFWRCHRVHHADPVVDVTTTIRQHPGESVIRYGFLAVFALGLGASPGAFAVYRVWSALNGLLEHADVRAPEGLDRVLSWITTWPHMHKVHHSRRADETNTNYGNIVSVFDRLLGTFTPSGRGVDVPYGLDGIDEPAMQTTAGLLTMPFRDAPRPAAGAAIVAGSPRTRAAGIRCLPEP
jgi:sterol desaturase/sphingolipid hydroxylase (fatty acid hydroxylase superfamily)